MLGRSRKRVFQLRHHRRPLRETIHDLPFRHLPSRTTMIATADIAKVKPLLSLTDSDTTYVFALNFLELHKCSSLAAKQMIAQGSPVFEHKLIGAAKIVALKPLLWHSSVPKRQGRADAGVYDGVGGTLNQGERV